MLENFDIDLCKKCTHNYVRKTGSNGRSDGWGSTNSAPTCNRYEDIGQRSTIWDNKKCFKKKGKR